MEYKKIMITIILAIFLFSIASVCASDVNDTAIASEDTQAIELSQNEEITTTDESQKTIQTNDTEMLTANDEETTATQNNLDTLSLEEKTYTDLSNAVGTGGDINLQPAYYKYNGESNTITITNPGIINGNGAIIDMAGSTIQAFNVNTAGVTIKNLTIKNTKYKGDGGAIYFAQSGSVINCNFNDNKATGSTSYGGAVYFKSTGNVSNCNFTGNTAANGGAVWMNSGTVSNCNFINNSATGEDSLGGAIVMYSGSVSNCNFTNNHASYAGAVYFYQGTGSVTNCNFTNNTATYQGGAIRFSDTGNVTNCNFTGNTASGDGGAIWMYSGSVENCNFTNNTATYQGGAIFSWNWYTAADTCIFKRNSGENVNVVIYPPTLNVDNFTTFYGSGEKLTFNLTTDSGMPVTNGNISISVYFKDNNTWVGNYSCLSGEGWTISLPVGSYYANFTTEYAGFEAISRTIKIIPNIPYYVNVTPVTTNNRTVNITAKSNIPQDIMEGKLLFILPNGANITANYAGNGTWWAEHTFDAYDVYQVNVTYVGLDNVTVNNGTISISKTPTNITVVNTTVNLFVLDSVATGAALTPADAGNLTFTSSNYSVAKVENGYIIAVGGGTAIITVSFAGSEDYAAAENKTITVNVIKYDSKVTISQINDTDYPNNVTVEYSIENRTNVSITIDGVPQDKIIITNDTITVIGLDAGEYTITIINNESDLYYKSNDTKTFTVNPLSTSIAASDISTTYNINKDLVITLKDSKGEALSGVKVTVNLKGTKTYTTDKNGQIKINVAKLVPKVYTAKVTFDGNTNYAKSTADVKVTVKKAKPKIIAKKKTYKAKKKTKKFTITLKDNKGKPIKKVKVRLIVQKIKKTSKNKNKKSKKNKRKNIVKTNKKGKATFKINRYKKGKYLATVKFYGNKYYAKTVKKVKINLK